MSKKLVTNPVASSAHVVGSGSTRSPVGCGRRIPATRIALYARVVAPQVRAYAPALLGGYRSPFGGEIYIPGRAWTPEQARRAAAREGQGYAPGNEPVWQTRSTSELDPRWIH